VRESIEASCRARETRYRSRAIAITHGIRAERKRLQADCKPKQTPAASRRFISLLTRISNPCCRCCRALSPEIVARSAIIRQSASNYSHTNFTVIRSRSDLDRDPNNVASTTDASLASIIALNTPATYFARVPRTIQSTAFTQRKRAGTRVTRSKLNE